MNQPLAYFTFRQPPSSFEDSETSSGFPSSLNGRLKRVELPRPAPQSKPIITYALLPPENPTKFNPKPRFPEKRPQRSVAWSETPSANQLYENSNSLPSGCAAGNIFPPQRGPFNYEGMSPCGQTFVPSSRQYATSSASKFSDAGMQQRRMGPFAAAPKFSFGNANATRLETTQPVATMRPPLQWSDESSTAKSCVYPQTADSTNGNTFQFASPEEYFWKFPVDMPSGASSILPAFEKPDPKLKGGLPLLEPLSEVSNDCSLGTFNCISEMFQNDDASVEALLKAVTSLDDSQELPDNSSAAVEPATHAHDFQDHHLHFLMPGNDAFSADHARAHEQSWNLALP